MKQIAPLSDFTDQADEIFTDEDEISELNADRNYQMLGRIFSDFEQVFTAVNK